jgi:DNA-binding response OmpR family regulator
MEGKNRILIVEDEKRIARFLQLELEHEGYKCTIEHSGSDALDNVAQTHYDLILLDIMLPDIDGLSVCKQVRQISNVPILILSARDDVESKVAGLDLGADDYLTKPFNSKELFARIRVLLRKGVNDRATENTLYLRDMVVHLDQREVQIGQRIISLTKKEFQLLTFLIRNKNFVVTRDRILEEVWGYDYIGDTNVVDVYVRYLRGKIDEKVGKKYIFTIRGTGYVARD